MIFQGIAETVLAGEKDGNILPDYGRYCVSSIPGTVQYIFGEKTSSPFAGMLEKAGIAPDRNRKVVVLLLDAFGWDQWQRYQTEYEFLTRLTDRGVTSPITSVYPSITPVVMTTLHSGLTPQEHGVPASLAYFKELDKIISVLHFKPMGGDRNDQLLDEGVDPGILFDRETIYEKLEKSGIASYGVAHASLEGSAFTTVTTKGSGSVPYQWAEGLRDTLYSSLVNTPAPAYFLAYWGLIDIAGHRHGIHSPEYLDILNSLFSRLQELIMTLPSSVAEETVLMVCADHGHYNLNTDNRICMDEYPEVLKNLRRKPDGGRILPWEQSRLMFLAVEENRIDETCRYLQSELQGKAEVLKTAEALKQGLFGTGGIHPRLQDRIGDILLLPEKSWTIWYRYPGIELPNPKGSHGGLTPEEMLVPLAVVKMSDLH